MISAIDRIPWFNQEAPLEKGIWSSFGWVGAEVGLPRFGGRLRVVVVSDEVHSERSRVSAPPMGEWKRATLPSGLDIAQSSRRLPSRPGFEVDRGLVAEA